jgi:hypothetical protein
LAPLEDLIDQTKWLLHQVEAVGQTLEQLQDQLSLRGEELRARLTEMRLAGDRQPTEQVLAVKAERKGAKDGEAGQPAANGRSERRSAPRRRGNAVAVRLDEPAVQGWVLDRSPDGFCLLTDVEVPAGARVRACPAEQRSSPRWFGVEVRSCRRKGKNWVVGCQFTHPLTWDEQLLFG